MAIYKKQSLTKQFSRKNHAKANVCGNTYKLKTVKKYCNKYFLIITIEDEKYLDALKAIPTNSLKKQP